MQNQQEDDGMASESRYTCLWRNQIEWTTGRKRKIKSRRQEREGKRKTTKMTKEQNKRRKEKKWSLVDVLYTSYNIMYWYLGKFRVYVKYWNLPQSLKILSLNHLPYSSLMGRKPQKSYEERPSLACLSLPWVWMNRKSVLVASGSLLVIVQAVGMNQFKIQESSVLFAGYYIPSHVTWVAFQVHHGPHLLLIMTRTSY